MENTTMNMTNVNEAAPVEEQKVTEEVTETVAEEATNAVEEAVEEEPFDEDAMFTDEPVDRIETIDPAEYKKALRKRFFMDGVSMEKYKIFVNAISFGILSEETVAGIATLLFEQITEEDKTSYNMKAIESFIKFGLMGRMESANAYLPDEDDINALNTLTISIDQLTPFQDTILETQLDNMLRNFFGLVFAKPVFAPDELKKQAEKAAKAKAKADKAAEKAEKKAAKDAAKASKSKKEAKSQETEDNQESEPEENKKKEGLGNKLKNKISEAKEKADAKKASKKKKVDVSEEDGNCSDCECEECAE